MAFIVTGLPIEKFQPLFELDDETLLARSILRQKVNAYPGFPCRVTLQDAKIGETILLLNYVSHAVSTPYRTAYAIYVRETATKSATYHNQLPPVFENRTFSLRGFSKDGMLQTGVVAHSKQVKQEIKQIFKNRNVAYIHAHNAAYGCFAAEMKRAEKN